LENRFRAKTLKIWIQFLLLQYLFSIESLFNIVSNPFVVVVDGPEVDRSTAAMTEDEALQKHYAKGCYIKECTTVLNESTVDPDRHQSLLKKGVDFILKSDRTYCAEHRKRTAEEFLCSKLAFGEHTDDSSLSDASHAQMGCQGFSRPELVRYAQGIRDFCIIQMPACVVIGRRLGKKLITRLQQRSRKQTRYDLAQFRCVSNISFNHILIRSEVGGAKEKGDGEEPPSKIQKMYDFCSFEIVFYGMQETGEVRI
jgi:hypothetical protein